MIIPENKNIIVPLLFYFVISFGMVSCGGNTKELNETPTRGKTRISVDESFQLLIDSEINTFMTLYPYAYITAEYKPEYDVIADGIDVTWKIRKKKVDSRVSRVSAYPGVRKALTKQQRRIGLVGKVIMVGRDIGTVVLPEADLKIYLDASVAERANRRYNQRVDRGEDVDLGKILKKLEKRDNIDSTREVAPLRAAEDAVLINTDDLSIGEVVSKIEKIALNMMKE